MIHDFAITETDVVFWELPVLFDLAAATQWIANPDSGVFPYRWDPSYGARIGVHAARRRGHRRPLVRDRPLLRVPRRQRLPDTATRSCSTSAASRSMFEPGQLLGGDLSLRRWTVDTATGRVRDEVVETDGPGRAAVPRPAPGRPRAPLRLLRPDPRQPGHRRVRRPHQARLPRGSVEVWDPGPGRHAGRVAVRARRTPTEPTTPGWLLTFLHDDARAAASWSSSTQRTCAAGPVARIATPQRVPYGFHAAWVPA